MNQLTISPSPHVHSGDSVRRNMVGVLIALVPALAVSVWQFGLNSLAVIATSIAACVVFEFLIQKYILKTRTTISDCSAILTGLILAFNLPSNLPLWIVVVGAAFAIGVCKMAFGGLGQNIVNPAIAGRVFLLVSFPAPMTSWPVPHAIDGATGATPLAIMKASIKTGKPLSEFAVDLPSTFDMMMGNVGGSLGEVGAAALLLGLVFLLIRRIISWHIPVSILLTMTIVAALFNLADPQTYASPVYHLLSGGALLGAIFMATDYVTSPMSPRGMLIYGFGIGLLTMLIRNCGAYPEGMSFAILLMNLCTPLINTYCKPKRFGEATK